MKRSRWVGDSRTQLSFEFTRPGWTGPAATLGLALALAFVGATVEAKTLAVISPDTYLPGLPVLVRVELLNDAGRPDRTAWDVDATLEVAQPGVSLSTNRVELHNGMGSALVTFVGGGGGDLDLTVRANGLSTAQSLHGLGSMPTLEIGGTLAGNATTWTGIVRITNDVLVPTGHVLTIEAGTWVLLNGVASGTNGADLQVNGEIRSLGTRAAPVVITCASAGLRWGQIRHTSAAPSVYRHTIITLGGRARGEGHTGQAPVIRPTNSRVTFEHCSLTDYATPAGTPGKIMQSAGSDIVMTNCLLSRARMGPEIGGTSLQFLDSYIIDMRGPDDADGIYLHSQGASQVIRLAGSVVVGGDDDGIDTLGANITVEDCIVRGWKFPGDDSKGISVFGGECRLWRSLIVDNTIGLSGKGGNDENVRVRIDRSTIVGLSYGVAVTNKSGTTPIIDYRITNSILLAPDPVFTQYDPADIHVDYSLVGEEWPGTGILMGDPTFIEAGAGDYRLRSSSICIDAGDPVSGLDPDGSRADIGVFIFTAPAPEIVGPIGFENGRFAFTLKAYPNRPYRLETSAGLPQWTLWRTEVPTLEETRITDQTSGPVGARFYRVQPGP
jgi:hypothetical protein